jgi:hypothetical protein
MLNRVTTVVCTLGAAGMTVLAAAALSWSTPTGPPAPSADMQGAVEDAHRVATSLDALNLRMSEVLVPASAACASPPEPVLVGAFPPTTTPASPP